MMIYKVYIIHAVKTQIVEYENIQNCKLKLNQNDIVIERNIRNMFKWMIPFEKSKLYHIV